MKITYMISAVVLGTGLAFSAVTPAAIAQDAPAVTAEVSLPSGTLTKKKKKLRGNWEVVQRDGNTYIQFDEDFVAARGPDLKVFLSPQSIADVTGKTAIEGALNIGELQKTKGAQEYLIPAEVNLSDYTSVLVHCEQYAVLWGGSDL